MKNTVLLALMLLGFASEAQIKRYSFKVAANYPLIKDVTTLDVMTLTAPWYMGTSGSNPINYTAETTIRQSFKGHMGFDASGNIDYAVSKKLFLTTGLTISYLRFKQIITIESLGTSQSLTEIPAKGGGIIGDFYGSITFRDTEGDFVTQPAQLTQSDKLGETTTLYLQTPILVGVSLLKDKFLIRGGATFSFLLNTSSYKLQSSYHGTAFVLSDYKDNTKEGYTDVMSSGTIQATYLIAKRIGVDFSFNKYFTSIYSNNDQSKKAKYNTLSLGLSYNLSK